MATKFNNRYRIESSRWAYWDYGTKGSYFITICSHNMLHRFGCIRGQSMLPNEAGDFANACWADIPNHFEDVELGKFQLMPNHFHGIITLTRDHLFNGGLWNPNETPADRRRGNAGKNTVSTMVGSFKSAVSRLAHIEDPTFRWQERFHDHVIRDQGEYDRISNYIVNNPANWKEDRFFVE